MKKFHFLLLALMFACLTLTSGTAENFVKIHVSSTPAIKPNDSETIPFSCYYDEYSGLLTVSFSEGLGTVDVIITNLSTNEVLIDQVCAFNM